MVAVHDGAGVRIGAAVAQSAPSRSDLHQRLLHQILGLAVVAGQKEGAADQRVTASGSPRSEAITPVVVHADPPGLVSYVLNARGVRIGWELTRECRTLD
jgi:hypothetical protein